MKTQSTFALAVIDSQTDPVIPTDRDLRHLTDEAMLKNTKALAVKEREILVDLLHHLLEVDTRKLFSPRFTSLQDYAENELGYSSDQAWRRVNAMRLLKAMPEIETKIADASLNLTTLGLAQSHFRAEGTLKEKKLAVLKAIAGKTTREAARELLQLSNEPDRVRPESVRPVSQVMNEIKIFVHDDVLQKIERLKGRLAHKYPHLTNAQLFELLLDQALEKKDPSREPSLATKEKRDGNGCVSAGARAARIPTSQTRPRPTEPIAAPRPESRSATKVNLENTKVNFERAKRRSPPASLKRELFRRAGNRCENCGSYHAPQSEHIAAYALGGLTTLANMKVLCRNCNQRARVQVFGR